MRYTFKHTIYSAYLGYITQAIIVNLSPLLFVTFVARLGLSLTQLGLLISLNFGVQIVTDLIAIKFIDRLPTFRAPVVAAHVLAAVGLVSLGVLPFMMPPYLGICLATVLMAIGGGLIEVVVSPLVESCPGEAKASAMSLLHAFYCWGQVGVVVLSTLFFLFVSTAHWYVLPLLWAIVPAFNVLLLRKVPMNPLVAEGDQIVPVSRLFGVKIFWILLMLMIGAGASELAMCQWASLFAESGLGVSKTVGDLLGPCAFALLMGVTRTFYGTKGAKIKLSRFMILSAVLCVLSYLLAVFAPHPLLSLVGCALCGLSVGIMWPGTISLAAEAYPQGGGAMFAILALAGDLGCSVGPALVGAISARVIANGTADAGANLTEMGLKTGLGWALLFPVMVIGGVMWLRRAKKREDSQPQGFTPQS